MKKIKVHLGIGYAGACHDDVLKIDDEEFATMTPDDIDEYVREWAYNYIDIGYKVLDGDDE